MKTLHWPCVLPIQIYLGQLRQKSSPLQIIEYGRERNDQYFQT